MYKNCFLEKNITIQRKKNLLRNFCMRVNYFLENNLLIWKLMKNKCKIRNHISANRQNNWRMKLRKIKRINKKKVLCTMHFESGLCYLPSDFRRDLSPSIHLSYLTRLLAFSRNYQNEAKREPKSHQPLVFL